MSLQVRQPDCEACPLNTQRKVWGTGPLTATTLAVLEMPGPDEEDQGVPCVGPAGQIFDAVLVGAGLKRSELRIENVAQCRAPYESARGKQAVACCGPSLSQVIRAMPNLRSIIAFGEAALQEVTGYRASLVERKATEQANKQAEREHIKAWRAYERAMARHFKARDRWLAKQAKPPKRAAKPLGLEPQPPTPPVGAPAMLPLPPLRGHHGITVWRGSPLNLRLSDPERTILVYPVIHPAATFPKRQPRLRPLLALDMRKFARLAAGERAPEPQWQEMTTALGLIDWFGGVPPGPIGLDLEWSRRENELVMICVGGPGERYALMPFLKPDGWRLAPQQRSDLLRVLQMEFDNGEREWGGHYASAYDALKLAELGLKFHARWDSLYAFHVLYSEFGSSRDEVSFAAKAHTQATGYDLGFVSSTLTLYCLAPEHKVLTADLRYVPLGTVREGDRLISVTSNPRGKVRRFVATTVRHCALVNAPRWAVTLSDGTQQIVTETHRWLASQRRGRDRRVRWIETRALVPGRSQIPRLLDVWDYDQSREAGWLAGLYDGEGSLVLQGGGLQVSLTQNTGSVLTTAKRLLQARGFKLGDYNKHGTHDRCRSLVVSRGKRETARLLGTLRPIRLLRKFKPSLLGSTETHAPNWVTVVSIEQVDVGPVVALQTTTGSLIVEGFAHHNCYHKGVVTGERDALDSPFEVVAPYCVGDVARSYHSWLAMSGEPNILGSTQAPALRIDKRREPDTFRLTNRSPDGRESGELVTSSPGDLTVPRWQP